MALTQVAEPERLTTVETVPGVFFAQAARQGNRVALRRKRFGIWHPVTWTDYARHVRLVAHALAALGTRRGEAVGVIGENRPEWAYTDLGVQALGAATTGIYTTSSPEQVHYILDHAACRIFIVEGEEQLDKALQIRGRLDALEHIVVMDPEGLRTFRDRHVVMWDDFLTMGEDHARRDAGAVDARLAEVRSDDVAALLYTSGTTGPPKGVMLTHTNILWAASALGEALQFTEQDEVLSFLPLSHVAERLLSIFIPVQYAHTVNFLENVDTLLDNMVEVEPTVFLAVPRLWEKLYSTVVLQVKDNDPVKRWAFAAAVALSAKAHRARGDRARTGRGSAPFWLDALARVADLSVLLPLRRRLGLHRARVALSAAAPIAPDLLDAFWALGVRIYEGYGLTEGAGPTSFNRPGACRIGTVGRPLRGAEVKIASDGEILTRSPGVFAGYFRNPDASAAAIDDGWLYTGDVGSMDDDGYLRITDRKKDLFVTSGGKNIAPQYIENKLKASSYVNDAVVIGDGKRYIIALIVIDEDNVTHWAQERRLPFTTYSDLATNPDVRGLIESEVAAVNKTLSGPEQVRRFAILPKRLHAEDGEVTATMKVKRLAIMDRYADVIADLYRT
jgi:long-chain acyl-CoA synthetase